MQGRRALSLRALSREYGLSREFLGELVRLGDLPALRRGRALLVLREDFESWWRSRAVRQTSHAEAVVERALARQESNGAAS
jgi:hypothetical protein